MNKQLEKKLKQLPNSPGVYFHKNTKDQIIYIGKAAVLRNRVRQYFQKSRARDPKTEALVAEIADVDWTTVDSEMDALFLEAELIRRYLPPYNILLRDDKSVAYVRMSYSASHPTVSITRRPLDDDARYYGPFYSAVGVRKALKYLRKIFPYSTHAPTAIPKRACLQYHLGLCPGIEDNKTPLKDYRRNLQKLSAYLKGERVQLMKSIKKDMQQAAKTKNFEQAAELRNQYRALESLNKQVIFSKDEFLDISKDLGLSELADLLGIAPPKRIEGFDISHMSGTDNAASMVVFTNGMPDKAMYRKFKMRLPGNDDFGHMNEALARRLSEKNIAQWGKPDLVLIDGGKGQLQAAIKARDALSHEIPMIGLAKREETIVVHNDRSFVSVEKSKRAHVVTGEKFTELLLPASAHAVKLLQRIRDESHRFAVSYHSVLKSKRQIASLLDEIPTIGPATRKKLLKTFGSVKGVIQARRADLEKAVGPNKAAILQQYLRSYKKNYDNQESQPEKKND